MALLDAYGIVLFRDHDRIHAHVPDGIFYGLFAELGWLSYLDQPLDVPTDPGQPLIRTLTLPDIPVAKIAAMFKEKLGLKAVRFTGNPGTIVRKAALAAHLFPNQQKLIEAIEREKIDLLIPGEIIDWEVPCYFKDAGQLGLNKACLHLGHFNMEELGDEVRGELAAGAGARPAGGLLPERGYVPVFLIIKRPDTAKAPCHDGKGLSDCRKISLAET